MAFPTTARVRRALPWITLGLAGVVLLAIVTVDKPIARFYASHGVEARADWLRVLGWLDKLTGSDLPRWWIGPLDVKRWCAAIMLVVAGVVALANPRWRRGANVWFFAAAVHVVTRYASEELKPVFGRLRPSQWVVKGGDMFFREGGSMPSGYAAYYFGLVAPFAVARPRIGIPLLVVPVFVSWSRVAVDAHFVSDVTASAMMVALVTWLFAIAFRIGR